MSLLFIKQGLKKNILFIRLVMMLCMDNKNSATKNRYKSFNVYVFNVYFLYNQECRLFLF